MNISVERADWTQHNPDLVVLVGDPYSDYIGPAPESIQERLQAYEQGFASGRLKREICFSGNWQDSGSFDFIYYHTSMQKGFTATETLKTFLAQALRLAADTGRKTVTMLLRGPQGEGLLEQLVEGSLVGTYSFREYKKDPSDPYEEIHLVLCPPAPVPEVPVQPVVEEAAVVAEESPKTVAVETLPEEVEKALEEEPTTSEESTAETESDESTDSEQATEGGHAAEPQSDEATEKSDGEAVDGESSDDESEQASKSQPETETETEPEPEPGPEPEPEQPAEPVVSDEVWQALKQADDSALQVGRAFADGVNLARTLIATPAADCTPDHLAKQAKKLASAYGLSWQAFGPKLLEKHEYNGLCTVGKGADNPPRLIELTYTPEQESPVHLVLLGKGVTFDSGGISIKPADKMHLMIGDMSGAAAVMGAMEIIGRLKPAIKVTAIVVSAENKPGSKSYRPGDIIRYKNGISVHVENTDAEGRLILADGLIRAGELGATHIVDIATLTGAAARALGPSFTGVMGANRKLVNAITRAGGNHGESYWRLPMPLEYRDMLKSSVADINNMGGPKAGATTAALFLKEFVPAGTPWVHLDIAGTFWKEKPWKYYAEGPSGTGVKTLADLALRWQEHVG